MLTARLTPPPSLAGGGQRPKDDVPSFDLATLFAGLESAEALVLAVSGGPDSMALMRLAARWAQRLGGAAPVLHVATVDHGFRVEARQETALVAASAASLGLPCAILAWAGAKPASRLQERARDARHALLAGQARAVGASCVLTAHHADDQAETILLRLARGSGLAGLAGMRRETTLPPGFRLVRPLLGLPKRDLVALCRSEGQNFAEDPSNHDPAYARGRLRAETAALERLGFDREGLLRLAWRMARADAALEAEVDRLTGRLTPLQEQGRVRIALAPARDAEPEIMLRLLRRIIASVVGPERIMRLDRLEALAEAVRVALIDGRSYRTTLAGAQLVLSRDTMLDVRPEPARRRGRDPARGERAANAVVRPD